MILAADIAVSLLLAPVLSCWAAGEAPAQGSMAEAEASYRMGVQVREAFLEEAHNCDEFDGVTKDMARIHRAGETVSVKDIQMAVSTIFFESSDSYSEQEAIAFVILNRWRNPKFGANSLYGVCTQNTGRNKDNPSGWQFEAQIWISGPPKQRRDVVCGAKLKSVLSALTRALTNSSAVKSTSSPHQHPGYIYYCRGKLPDGSPTWKSPPLDGGREAVLLGHQYFLTENECRVPKAPRSSVRKKKG